MGNDNSIDNKNICSYDESHYCFIKWQSNVYESMKSQLMKKKQFVMICRCLIKEALELGYNTQYDAEHEYVYAFFPSGAVKRIDKIEKNILNMKDDIDNLKKSVNEIIKILRDEQMRRIIFNNMINDEKEINKS